MADIPVIPRSVSLPTTLSFAHDPIAGLQAYTERYGNTFYLYIGGISKSLVTIDPEVAQHVLQKQHRRYEKSPIQTDVLSKYIGRGLLTNTGSSWLRQRRLIQPGFHRDRLATLTNIMQGVIDQELDLLCQRNKESGMDIYEEMLRITFRIVGRAIFSEDVVEEELNQLGAKITQIQEYVIKEVRLPFLRWWYILTGKRERNLSLSRDILDMQRQFIRRREENGATRDDLLQMLLDSRYEDTGLPMEEQQLVEETGILFVAGHETSANALAWTLYLLAKHPEIQEQLRNELEEIAPGRPPGFTELRSLPILTNVIKESMRLYPPAWITDRIALEDDEIGGVKIPKGTIVIPFIYGIHHATQYWDDPEEFRPDRFLNHQAPFTYFPFGGGPRLCIGNNFAMMEMQLVIAAWLRRFSFQLIPDQGIKAKALITLRPANGIQMYLQENK
ncbi:cytochrome P450 [Lewinella cohaerens]|uniref:cytochrome P450 n=1 Tax=Lewinella cohaerens TaxID=70995 RepID=UPI00036D05F7|nr:cytochrome P450 [Lewinella cohaerens]